MGRMISLTKNSGLDIRLDLDNLRLVFAESLSKVKPLIRPISQMQQVLLDKKIDNPLRELYYMYRGIQRAKDTQKILSNSLRYDVTVISAGFLGDELVKTAGHYHPGSYPEVYEVLWGEAFCLMQKPDGNEPSKIEDVILAKAKAKEKIVVLPGYGHVLINPSPHNPLVTANWVSVKFESDYSLYRQAGGAAYFVTNNEGEFKLIKNDYFSYIPEAKIMRPSLPLRTFGLSLDEPIYNILETSEKLDFLNFPNKYDYASCFITDKPLLSAIPL